MPMVLQGSVPWSKEQVDAVAWTSSPVSIVGSAGHGRRAVVPANCSIALAADSTRVAVSVFSSTALVMRLSADIARSPTSTSTKITRISAMLAPR